MCMVLSLTLMERMEPENHLPFSCSPLHLAETTSPTSNDNDISGDPGDSGDFGVDGGLEGSLCSSFRPLFYSTPFFRGGLAFRFKPRAFVEICFFRLEGCFLFVTRLFFIISANSFVNFRRTVFSLPFFLCYRTWTRCHYSQRISLISLLPRTHHFRHLISLSSNRWCRLESLHANFDLCHEQLFCSLVAMTLCVLST